MKKALCLLILLSFIQTAYASSAGRVLVIVGGVVLEMAKGFANELGREGARRLASEYPPPNPTQRTKTYAGSKGGYIRYEFVGFHDGSPVYKTTVSNDFIRNLREFDRKLDNEIDYMIRKGLIPREYERDLRRPLPYD